MNNLHSGAETRLSQQQMFGLLQNSTEFAYLSCEPLFFNPQKRAELTNVAFNSKDHQKYVPNERYVLSLNEELISLNLTPQAVLIAGYDNQHISTQLNFLGGVDSNGDLKRIIAFSIESVTFVNGDRVTLSYHVEAYPNGASPKTEPNDIYRTYLAAKSSAETFMAEELNKRKSSFVLDEILSRASNETVDDAYWGALQVRSGEYTITVGTFNPFTRKPFAGMAVLVTYMHRIPLFNGEIPLEMKRIEDSDNIGYIVSRLPKLADLQKKKNDVPILIIP